MKMRIKNSFFMHLLAAGMATVLVGQLPAQSLTTLYSFPSDVSSNGASPTGLLLSTNVFYGTTVFGGPYGNGTLFAMNTNGTAFTNLYNFAALNSNTNNDGAHPWNGVVQSGNTLYGTAGLGGAYGNGTIFAINIDGTGFTNLHSFTASDGGSPQSLILSGNTLYGATFGDNSPSWGGDSTNGTVFSIQTDGSGFTVLHSFSIVSTIPTNSEGANPYGPLTLSGDTLYGTAFSGGLYANGTIFALKTDGSSFTNLHNFSAFVEGPVYVTNADGGWPQTGVIVSGDTLFGATSTGGASNSGCIFRMNTDGTGFTTLQNLPANPGGMDYSAFPRLVVSGDTLYGTSLFGWPSTGVAFALRTDGSDFNVLHTFVPATDGHGQIRGLNLSGTTLYGSALLGGSADNGTIFSLSLLPQLTIVQSGTNAILSWPATASGFNLQSTTNLVQKGTWNTVSPGPIDLNGQNTVTNPISDAQCFYRLIQ